MNTFFITTFILWGLLSGMPTQASAQGSSQDSSQDSSASESGASSSFVGKRADVVIIILSVVLGVVVILTGASAILYAIAKRRNWAVHESMRRSARRAANALKSPLMTRFPRRGVEASHSPTLLTPASRRENRSSRGMTRIADEWPWNMHYPSMDSQTTIDSTQRAYSSTAWKKNSVNRPSLPYAGLGSGYTTKKPKRKPKRQDFDLERGIELGSTDNMKVTVSTAAQNPTPERWRALLAYGRQ